MKAEDIIYILLFILPGVIAEKISYNFDMPNDKKRSEFGDIVNGLLLSFPIILIASIAIEIIYGFTNMQQFVKASINIKCLFVIILLILIISIFIGILKGLIAQPIGDAINKFRRYQKKIEIDNESCWRKMFLDSPASRYLRVTINGKEYEGFVKHYSLPNEEKSIVLYTPEGLDDYPEYKNYINKVAGTYINLEKNIVIEDYDIKEYEKFCEKLKNKK